MLPRTTPLTNDDRRALRFTVGRCCAAEPAVLEEDQVKEQEEEKEECSYFVFSVVCFVCEVLGIRKKTARAKLQLAGVRVRSARQKNTQEERKLVGSS